MARQCSFGTGGAIGPFPSGQGPRSVVTDRDIQIDDPSVSRKHAVFRLASGRVELEDLQTPNGTAVGGRPVRGSVVLAEGQRIELGTATMQMTYTEGRADSGSDSSPCLDGARWALRGRHRRCKPGGDGGARHGRGRSSLCPVPDSHLLLYRREDGVLLHPDDRWRRSVPVPVTNTWSLVVMHRLSKRRVSAASARHGSTQSTSARTEWPEPAFVVARVDPPETTSFRDAASCGRWAVGSEQL